MNSSRSRIEAVQNWVMKYIVATASDQANTDATYLKALYAEEAEVLVQFSPCLLRLVEVLFQVYLHLISAVKRRHGKTPLISCTDL